MAGGFVIKKGNISLFKDFLIKKFNKTQIKSTEFLNLYLDSVIAPSALNEEFYEEINNLSPFGSGNNEPKFVLENLKVFSSTTVGNNHIKTLLSCSNGSIIKTIAFNAKNSSLEPYLDKNNKKKINIAKKIKLNEWKGKKKIEFEIEDIALN